MPWRRLPSGSSLRAGSTCLRGKRGTCRWANAFMQSSRVSGHMAVLQTPASSIPSLAAWRPVLLHPQCQHHLRLCSGQEVCPRCATTLMIMMCLYTCFQHVCSTLSNLFPCRILMTREWLLHGGCPHGLALPKAQASDQVREEWVPDGQRGALWWRAVAHMV
jgi:hypothetical protein